MDPVAITALPKRPTKLTSRGPRSIRQVSPSSRAQYTRRLQYDCFQPIPGHSSVSADMAAKERNAGDLRSSKTAAGATVRLDSTYIRDTRDRGPLRPTRRRDASMPPEVFSFRCCGCAYQLYCIFTLVSIVCIICRSI